MSQQTGFPEERDEPGGRVGDYPLLRRAGHVGGAGAGKEDFKVTPNKEIVFCVCIKQINTRIFVVQHAYCNLPFSSYYDFRFIKLCE